jgi:hypothetical protein
MTPAEIIKQQAAAVTGFNKLTAAEHLEAAAKLLREEAGQPKELTGIAYIKACKEKARAKGAAAFTAMGKFKQDQINNALADGGWVHVQTFAADDTQHYCRKGVQGSKLIISNGKFRVMAADTIICDWRDTKHLQAWVDSQKKK